MAVEWEVDGTTARGPSWAELVDKAVSILGIEDPELLRVRGTDLQILEYLKIREASLFKLIHWLNANMKPSDDALRLSVIHQSLVKLAKCECFYTTNYDNFIERAFQLAGREVTSIASEHDLSLRRSRTRIVKFHGDFNRPETMVLSESDYEKRMRLESLLDLMLRADVLGRAILFIGYSFKDPNVAYLFRLVNDHFQELPLSFVGRRAYIIVHQPSDFEMQLFNARRIQVIPTTGTERAVSVADVINEMAR